MEILHFNDYTEALLDGFTLPKFKCVCCGIVFTDTRNRHHKLCKNNPDGQQRKRKKNVKRGTRVNKNSLNIQPPVPNNRLKTYLQLAKRDGPQLPRLDPESPAVFRGELYCRYPGCSVTTRHKQPSAVLGHYSIKHDRVFKAFKTSAI